MEKLRLGKFSGKIYKEEEVSHMQECGLVISEEQSKDNDFITKRHFEDIKQCIRCFGCPLSKNSSIVSN